MATTDQQDPERGHDPSRRLDILNILSRTIQVKSSFFFCIALFTLLTVPSQAQVDQSSLFSATSVQTTTSNYYFAKPNELTIIVNVVGYVPRPGRYEISKSIDLINVIALAGGATPDGTLGDVRITRFVGPYGAPDIHEFKLDIQNISDVVPADLVLYPGDVIRVTRSSWATIRDVFSVVGYAAIVVTAAAQVAQASKR